MKSAGGGVKRIDAAVADKWFPNRSERWPSGYLPAAGIAHFLMPQGVSLRDVIDTRLEMRDDKKHLIQRDFAADYSLWLKSELSDFFARSSEHSTLRRLVRRITNRERLCSVEEWCSVFNLRNPADVKEPFLRAASAPNPNFKTETELESASASPYVFNSYAAAQELCMLPVRDALTSSSPDATVKFATFPQLRNCVYTDYDACSALKALSIAAGESLVYTQEFIHALATYLRERLEVYGDAAIVSRGASGEMQYRPILCTFGNGRLAWMLNETNIIPTRVIPTRLPQPLRNSRLRYQFPDGSVSSKFGATFPCEVVEIGRALELHKPVMILAEPHVDRDYLSDLRGYHTVREVLALGQIDSPAMGSFSFPLLSFGVTPGPATYWVYSDSLQRSTTLRGTQTLPMDPPFAAQGYKRVYVDSISKVMLHSNDTPLLQNQSRCLSFRRTHAPVFKCPETSKHPAST